MQRATEPGPATQPLPFMTARATQEQLPAITPVTGVTMRMWSGGRAMMNFITLDADGEVAWHSHPHEQLGTVLSGELRLRVGTEDAEPWILRAGDVYAVPPHVGHAATCGPEGAYVLDIFAPPREDYLAQARGVAGNATRTYIDPSQNGSGAR